MDAHDSAAVKVALAYFHAWTSGDFDAAMTYVSPQIRCQSPAGPVDGADALRAFMGPFATGLRSAGLLAAFGDDENALLMYDTETAAVAEAPGAEWHTVRKGRIVAMRIVFDRLPFELARREQRMG